MQTEPSKRCARCAESKPLAAYAPDRNMPDGRVARCRPCRAADQRERYQRDLESNRAKKRAYVAANLEVTRGRKREDARRWRAANPELARAKARDDSRQFRAQNPTYHREWYRQNAASECARMREMNHRRRSLIKDSPDLRAYMAELLKEPCTYCEAVDDMTVDHVVPLSRGGRHEAKNLTPACRSCNSSKCALLLEEWAGPPRLKEAA